MFKHFRGQYQIFNGWKVFNISTLVSFLHGVFTLKRFERYLYIRIYIYIYIKQTKNDPIKFRPDSSDYIL